MLNIIRIADVYYIENLSGRYGSWYEIDGVRCEPGATNICLSTLPTEILKCREVKTIDYYTNDTNTISIDEYNANVTELLKNATSEDNMHNFPTLEEEFEYKKYVQSWKPVYKSLIEKNIVDFTIYTSVESNNKYIIPLRLLGNHSFPNTILYKYTADVVAITHEIAKEMGFQLIYIKNAFSNITTKGKKYSIPNHGGIKYLVINGRYTNTSAEYYPISMGTLEECTRRYEEHKKIISGYFRDELASLNNMPITNNEREMLITKIREMDIYAKDITPIKKSIDTYHTMRKNIRDILETLVKNGQEQE